MDKVRAVFTAIQTWADAHPHQAIWSVFAIGFVIGWIV